MKAVTLLFSLFLWAGTQLSAQFTPFSPPAHLEQVVGNTKVIIDYDRPASRGRKIFGGLVPWNERWQTGASGTRINFSRAVSFGGQAVPAGTYGLLVVPGPKEWTLLLNTNGDEFGFVEYDETKNIAEVKVPAAKAGRFYDAFSIDLDISPENARMYLSWTDVQVSVPIETRTEELAMAYIDSLLAAPLVKISDPYFQAARYLLFTRRGDEKAPDIIHQLQRVDKGYYPYRMLMEAYVHLGQQVQALQTIEQGIEVTKREFAARPERLLSILKYWEEERGKVEAMLRP
ncbi:DUF2911 domain-containing protein [Neolewinella persica]|uniref:DUF2911 domain-containing protein n=1 Tax=Neolewinella persica TaxID=70998 RepID=UPI000367D4AA|nr:DUF2911 domain-containing protein [Neolewinella persica]